MRRVEAARREHIKPIGYAPLLRENPAFRRLWLSQVISNTGDWFNNIAVLGLVLQFTDSPAAAGWVFIAQQLPTFFLSPIAGSVVDRFSRRRVMVATHLIGAVIALGFLLVREPDQVWMAYILGAALISLSSFFQAGKNAAIPNLVNRGALMSANALYSSTWGATIVTGAALGGLVSAYLGRDVVFLLNAVSFLVAAWLIQSIQASFQERDRDNRDIYHAAPVWQGFDEAVAHIRGYTEVWMLFLVNAWWGLGGGVVLLLSVFGTQVFNAGDSGIGLLYAARGVGFFLGPYLARTVIRNEFRRMHRAIPVGFAFIGVFYSLFSVAPALAPAMLFVMLGHFASGIVFTLSSTMLQQLLPDRLRGRVFALSFGLETLAVSLSVFVVGQASEVFHPRVVARSTSMVFLIVATVYTILLVRNRSILTAVTPASEAFVAPETGKPRTYLSG